MLSNICFFQCQVRKTSQAALLVLLEQGLVEKSDVQEQVCPVIIRLTEADSLDDYRTEAVAVSSINFLSHFYFDANEKHFLFLIATDRIGRHKKKSRHERRRRKSWSGLKDMGSEMFDFLRYLSLFCPSTCPDLTTTITATTTTTTATSRSSKKEEFFFQLFVFSAILV